MSIRYFLIVLPVLLFASFKKPDCSYDSIIPVKLGMTKFEAANALNELGYYSKNYETKRSSEHDYLKKQGKSVQILYVNYSVKPNNCYSGKNGRMWLSFANDFLYKVEISSEFETSEYAAMKASYDSFVDAIGNAKRFKYQYSTTQSSGGE